MNKSRLLRFCLGLSMLLLITLSGYAVLAAAPLSGNPIPCTNGMAGEYPCAGVDLISQMPLEHHRCGREHRQRQRSLGLDRYPKPAKRMCAFGLTNGVSFTDISDPANPIYLGKLPAHVGASVYRDVKVYQDVASS
ncbi:MAG: hypothetical protein IPL78_36125 [Chloroflexi bacterium]|nr:hypothetical protein [Chloroflexota bacterium]